jgi:hypothetical protein
MCTSDGPMPIKACRGDVSSSGLRMYGLDVLGLLSPNAAQDATTTTVPIQAALNARADAIPEDGEASPAASW